MYGMLIEIKAETPAESHSDIVKVSKKVRSEKTPKGLQSATQQQVRRRMFSCILIEIQAELPVESNSEILQVSKKVRVEKKPKVSKKETLAEVPPVEGDKVSGNDASAPRYYT
jgi:hypothetical protein